MNQTVLNFNVVEVLNKVGIRLEDSKLNPDVLAELEPETKQLIDYLHFTEQQVYLFVAIYMINFDGFQFELRQVFEYLGLRPHSAPLYLHQINEMLDKRIISCDYSEGRRRTMGGYSYSNISINRDALKCILENKVLDTNALLVQSNMYSFCAYISDLIDMRSNNKFPTFILFEMVKEAENQNMHIVPVANLSASELSVEDRTMLYEMYDDIKRGGKSTSVQKTYDDIYDDAAERMKAIRGLVDEVSPLCTGDFVVSMGATYANELAVQLSEKSIDLLFENDATHIKSRFKARDTKSYTDIPVKDLFFEEKLQERIQFFSKALAQENFTAMQQRMTEKGLVKGLTAIFYGTPGTGKTESAYQIARQTGRDLYVVDASKTKSMWFGESEKVMRKLFESYRAQCKRSALTPILLFNEADAVLGARMENKKQSLDETVNAMKNILLEEMESFEGILIATTNLVNNMDKAFERRFMFKVEFTKPTAEALTQIWQSKMEWLQPDEIGSLVDRFAFSGGQIDNIVRKATLNEVLTGNRPTMSELVDYCTTENYSTKSGKRLGFN